MQLALFSPPGGMEWVIIIVIGLIIFGKRLPEVGRSLGRSIVEFKKGIKGIDDEIEKETGRTSRSSAPLQPYDARLGGDEADLRRMQEQQPGSKQPAGGSESAPNAST